MLTFITASLRVTGQVRTNPAADSRRSLNELSNIIKLLIKFIRSFIIFKKK